MQGNLRKMITEHRHPVLYKLPLSDSLIDLNPYIGKQINLNFLGQINCIKCERKTNKSFSQGFCFPCFQSAPETEECVLRPELCRAHEGIARDMEFAKNHCLIDHYVYLSLTSSIKVGVTRHTQIPTRWIDQGASQALIIAKTPNRYTAGLIEVALKNHLADKTQWQSMLKGIVKGNSNLLEEKERIMDLLPEELQQFFVKENNVTELKYPLSQIPEKVKSLNFDKEPAISGTLTGIKGQYLIFDNLYVINIRKFAGYLVEFHT